MYLRILNENYNSIDDVHTTIEKIIKYAESEIYPKIKKNVVMKFIMDVKNGVVNNYEGDAIPNAFELAPYINKLFKISNDNAKFSEVIISINNNGSCNIKFNYLD